MGFHEDQIQAAIDSLANIGLLTGPDPGTQEVTGGGYARISAVGAYAAPAAGSADLTAPLEFSGPAATVVTHVLFERTGALEDVVRPANSSLAFNSPDGRLDLATAPITSAFPA